MNENKIASDQAFDAMTIPMLEWNVAKDKSGITVVVAKRKSRELLVERVVKCRAPRVIILSQKRQLVYM